MESGYIQAGTVIVTVDNELKRHIQMRDKFVEFSTIKPAIEKRIVPVCMCPDLKEMCI